MKYFTKQAVKKREKSKNYPLNFLLITWLLILFCLNASANSSGKVSVVIPVYNVEKYIRECLDSVINQTYKNLEIICVDDCGTDNSVKIVGECAQKDKKIKVIHHDKNMGARRARNTGVKNYEGEYVFFVDSDDYINRDIIELMVKKQIETDADVVVANILVYTLDKGPFVEQRVQFNKNLLKFTSQDRYKINFNTFCDNLGNIFCVSGGKLYKKDFLIKNNI